MSHFYVGHAKHIVMCNLLIYIYGHAGVVVLTPVQWYIDLQADAVIRSFFGDPDWYAMWCRRPVPRNSSSANDGPPAVVLRAAATALAASAEAAVALSESNLSDTQLKAAATTAIAAAVLGAAGADRATASEALLQGRPAPVMSGPTARKWVDSPSVRRREAPIGHYWNSPESDRLRGWLPVVDADSVLSALDDFYSSTWEIIADWGEPFTGAVYSSGTIGLRCTSLQECDRNKSTNTQLLAITPGPKEPECIDILLKRTADVFRAFGPIRTDDSSAFGWSGLQIHVKGIQPHHQPPCDLSFYSRLYLTGFIADSKLRQKVAHESGTGAFYMCGGCFFSGASYPGPKKSTVYYKGYFYPAPQFRCANLIMIYDMHVHIQ